jgi:hypothetical protein
VEWETGRGGGFAMVMRVRGAVWEERGVLLRLTGPLVLNQVLEESWLAWFIKLCQELFILKVTPSRLDVLEWRVKTFHVNIAPVPALVKEHWGKAWDRQHWMKSSLLGVLRDCLLSSVKKQCWAAPVPL